MIHIEGGKILIEGDLTQILKDCRNLYKVLESRDLGHIYEAGSLPDKDLSKCVMNALYDLLDEKAPGAAENLRLAQVAAMVNGMTKEEKEKLKEELQEKTGGKT